MNGDTYDDSAAGLPLHYSSNNNNNHYLSSSSSGVPLTGVHVMDAGTSSSSASALSARSRRSHLLPGEATPAAPIYPEYDQDDEKKRDAYDLLDDEKAALRHSANNNLSAAAFGSLSTSSSGAYGQSASSSLSKSKASNKWENLVSTSTNSRSWPQAIWKFIVDNRDLGPLIGYTILSLATRLYRIGKADTVVWDEAHFGKFGAYYINQTFYFDVHPPLGKMLIGLAGALCGFNGSFDFHSGAKYPEHVPYHAMRILMAMPGVALVPLAWGTAYELGFTWYGQHIVTLMVLCDLAWLVISRFILLDSMLLFFTFTTVYCMAVFHNQQRWPFSPDWWAWLFLTGVSIGCVASIKLVGLFVTCLVGIYTAEDLWNKFGDLRMPLRVYMKHWVARILCLIVTPIAVYMLCFKIHFLILSRSGPGDAQMSSLFQAHLRGNDFGKNPLEPVFGSRVTLKNMAYGGGLLHSHPSTYPVGSSQQQITCYHYRDSNNDWILTPRWEDPPVDPEGELEYIKDGSVLRLVHAMTTRNLHSHNIVAPLSKEHWEVSGYGNSTIGDSNDYWVVEVVDDLVRGKKKNFEHVNSLTTRLRFRHLNSKCYLRANGRSLPAWGFQQIEVSCDKQNDPKDERTYWNIESHHNDRLPPGNVKLYRSPFLRDFWHLNVAMMQSNNALVPDEDKQDIIASKPFDWPFQYVGMRMNGWGDKNTKFYLLGHPLVWQWSTISLPLFILAFVWYLCRGQRRCNDLSPVQWDHFLFVGKIGFFGWCLHYMPFVIMSRVTYIHHYLPTLWFSVLLSTFLLDHFIFARRRLTYRAKTILFTLIVSAIVGVFLWFRDIAFGMEGPVTKHWGLKWRKSWNIYP